MSIQRIPYQKRLEHLAEGPGVEAIRLVPVLHKFAALRLGDYLGGEQLEVVLEAVGRLGVTPDSSLSETAGAVRWAGEHLTELASGSSGKSNIAPFEIRRKLNLATHELFVRLDYKAVLPAEKTGSTWALRSVRKEGNSVPKKIPLVKRIESIEAERIVKQIGKAGFRHYVDAFQYLLGDDPELNDAGEAVRKQMQRGSIAAVSAIAQRARKARPELTAGAPCTVFFINSLACMCDNPLDFSKRLGLTGEIQIPCEQCQDWQKFDELPKSEGY